MHNQSALTELAPPNLAPFLLLDSVNVTMTTGWEKAIQKILQMSFMDGPSHFRRRCRPHNTLAGERSFLSPIRLAGQRKWGRKGKL